MIDFLLKSTISLCVLLAVYHLVLEKEKIHKFNRFYLLFCLLFSFTIPFITIEVIQEITNPMLAQNSSRNAEETIDVLKEETNYWLIAIWTMYLIMTSIFLFRFVRNIIKLNVKTKSNPAISYKGARLILLKEKTLPYTFLNTIFINQEDYHNRKIEAELYTHELIHVTQRHTLDILLVETLKVLFWFNPIFIFYRKAIQLNHEFLADEKVVKSHNNVSFYQNLLISKANIHPAYNLASNLNYSVTKKRLIMMTRTTSTTRAMLKKTILIPVLSILIFFVCVKTVAQERRITNSTEQQNPITGMEKYFENTVFKFQDKKGNIIDQKRFSELSSEDKKNIPPPPPPAKDKEMVKKMAGPKTIYIPVNGTDHYFKNKIYKIKDVNGKVIGEKKFAELTLEEKKNIPPPPPPAIKGK
jgi:beta-lactamase regulating signal transducer with metallopeptidase domain